MLITKALIWIVLFGDAGLIATNGSCKSAVKRPGDDDKESHFPSKNQQRKQSWQSKGRRLVVTEFTEGLEMQVSAHSGDNQSIWSFVVGH